MGSPGETNDYNQYSIMNMYQFENLYYSPSRLAS